MRFTPKTEEEIQSMNLIDPGIYQYEVAAAKEKMSKSGNEMIELSLRIWDKNGQEKMVFDYLLEAMQFKLLHFTETTGLAENYKAGNLRADDCVGRAGNVEIIVQKGQVNPMGGMYPDKNAVKDYLENKILSAKKDDSPPFVDDDTIPF